MIPLLASRPRRQCNAFARERDARIRRLLDQHPVTAAMLHALGWFPTRALALKRLRRLVQRRQVRLVGTVCRTAGRPEHVYCHYRPKADSLLHEVELTDPCLRLGAGKILRGPRVTDRTLRPDAEVWINGRLYHLELDRGTMGYAQIRRRFRLYESSPHLTLWVCSSRSGWRGCGGWPKGSGERPSSRRSPRRWSRRTERSGSTTAASERLSRGRGKGAGIKAGCDGGRFHPPGCGRRSAAGLRCGTRAAGRRGSPSGRPRRAGRSRQMPTPCREARAAARRTPRPPGRRTGPFFTPGCGRAAEMISDRGTPTKRADRLAGS